MRANHGHGIAIALVLPVVLAAVGTLAYGIHLVAAHFSTPKPVPVVAPLVVKTTTAQ